jgi:hypothetical protein
VQFPGFAIPYRGEGSFPKDAAGKIYGCDLYGIDVIELATGTVWDGASVFDVKVISRHNAAPL